MVSMRNLGAKAAAGCLSWHLYCLASQCQDVGFNRMQRYLPLTQELLLVEPKSQFNAIENRPLAGAWNSVDMYKPG